jgi:hypothetical protein
MNNNEAPKGPAAPERIWIQSDHIPDFVALDKWDQKPDPDENQLFTEYTRADLLTAAQARAEQAEAEVKRVTPQRLASELRQEGYLIPISAITRILAALREGGEDTAQKGGE